jgi:hypothetical protein
MYCYCGNDAVNRCDPSGLAYEGTATWAGSMWWLTLVDGPIPAGDIVYGIGIVGFAIYDTVSTIGADNVVKLYVDGPQAVADGLMNAKTWLNSTFGTGNGLPGPGKPGWNDTGYKNFDQLKKAYEAVHGKLGKNQELHHIVERSQMKNSRSGFSSYAVNNSRNVVAVSKDLNAAINKYYSSKPRGQFGDLTVRDWLTGQSFEAQYKFGLEVLAKAKAGLL